MLQTIPSILSVCRAPTPRGRLIRGVVANLGDKCAILLIQLLTIPVFTLHWGAEGFGTWLMLCTIPTYLQLSDFGIGTAAGIEITQHAAKGDTAKALVVLHSAWAFIAAVISLIALSAIVYAHFLYSRVEVASDAGFDQKTIALAVIVFVLYSLAATQMSILSVVYRATNKFATSTTFSAATYSLEGTFGLIAVLNGTGLLFVASGYLVIRLIGYVLYLAYLKRVEPWVEFGISKAERHTLRRLAKPSGAALLLALSNALILQGTLLTLGWFYSAALVAVFAAARTLTRIPLQFSGLFIRPSIPELTRSILGGNRKLTKRIVMLNALIAVATTVPFTVLVVIVGPTALDFLSHGKLDAPLGLFVFLLLAVIGNALWTALATPLVATNRQSEFSHLYALIAVCIVATPALLQTDLTLVSAAIAIGEALMVGVVLRLVTKAGAANSVSE